MVTIILITKKFNHQIIGKHLKNRYLLNVKFKTHSFHIIFYKMPERVCHS